MRLTLVMEQDCKPTEKGGMYYEFRQNTRSVKSTILHFQVSELPFLSLLAFEICYMVII
jgi:hypothetical protein